MKEREEFDEGMMFSSTAELSSQLMEERAEFGRGMRSIPLIPTILSLLFSLFLFLPPLFLPVTSSVPSLFQPAI
jgi:hypothetical protein